ncbi:zinc finger CCCH domain-containing protein 14 [Aristolochia californica]|uniref:zinc finger CCCH domain-containing protein 14 n=1 Tax=Aristolochia californica TaxID=171875 RepID=UPI0035DA7354
MDSFGAARKRIRPDAALNGNGGFAGSKKFRQEMESFSTGIGSKSKPCTKFFSTAGCPFGEGCHFLHYVPGGINAVAQMANLPSPVIPAPRNPVGGPPMGDATSGSVVKTRMCNKYNTPEGCKFGDKCHFAHGEKELGKPIIPGHDDRMLPPPLGARMPPGPGRLEPPPPGLAAAASFGASATAKISVDASLAGAIIGKGGVNSKHICRVTGAKLAIREHESDPNLRNIELEGTFDQIKQASVMVRDFIVNFGPSTTGATPGKPPSLGAPATPGSNYKTKLCDNFTKGSCTFGERCHFAHGGSELRKSGV